MELIREVQQGINMIKYLACEPDKFTKPYVALLVAFMQMSGGLFAEIVNILVLCQRHDAIHCLEHFVAFELLTHVDDIYCHALPHFPLKDELEHPLHLKKNSDGVMKKGCTAVLLFVFEKLLNWFYTLIFYYFTPFWIGAIPYLYAVSPHKETVAAAGGEH